MFLPPGEVFQVFPMIGRPNNISKGVWAATNIACADGTGGCDPSALDDISEIDSWAPSSSYFDPSMVLHGPYGLSRCRPPTADMSWFCPTPSNNFQGAIPRSTGDPAQSKPVTDSGSRPDNAAGLVTYLNNKGCLIHKFGSLLVIACMFHRRHSPDRETLNIDAGNTLTGPTRR